MKSHSISVLMRYPLRRHVLILASTASAERSGSDATGRPFAVHPSNTVAGISRLRFVGALSFRLIGIIASPCVVIAAIVSHAAARVRSYSRDSMACISVSGGVA